MNPYFYNLTCSPFTSAEQPCELGERAVYSINVSTPADVQAGLEFVREHDVRLVSHLPILQRLCLRKARLSKTQGLSK